MLKVNSQRWQQSLEKLREQALKASHPRTRERFMGLYEIAKGKSATQVGRETNRNPQTVMEWVHRYNDSGSEALVYRHTGGHPPLCLSR
jgi:transposase